MDFHVYIVLRSEERSTSVYQTNVDQPYRTLIYIFVNETNIKQHKLNLRIIRAVMHDI
jgi:hypothetical protein